MQAEKTCRVCLRGSDELTLLRVRLPGKNKTLEETINFVVNIHIVLEHGLPDKICKDCGAMLDVADTFKQRCLESEAMLRQLDKGKGTDECRPKFEEKDRVSVKKCSAEDTSCVPQVKSCSSLSDSLRVKVKNEDNVRKQQIKIEILEEEYVDNGNTATEEANLHDKQELETPLSIVKEEIVIKEEVIEIPLNYVENEEFFNPMTHMQLLHYSCKECGKDFNSRESLELHRLQHTKDERCPKKLYLDDVKPSTSGLTAGTERQQATHYCTEGSITAQSADVIRVRKRGRPPKLGNTENDSKTGSKIKKKPSNDLKNLARTCTVERRFICNECDRPFIRKKILVSHMTIHTGEKRYSCNVCEKKFARKLQLENHSRTHTGDTPFCCSFCEKSFTQKVHLDCHEKIHLGYKPFSCDVCEKQFKRKIQLENHSRTHTGDRPFSCSFCEKSFSQKAHLDCHEKARHLGYKPFSCDVCEKKFFRKKHLDSHYITHTGQKPYSCSMCEKKFSQKNRLDVHIRIHKGEKPFSCNVCSKSYGDKGTLQKHEKAHTGGRPYSCNVCEKKFIQKPHLDSHVRIHTGERPYSCNMCEKNFRESSALYRHVRTQHKGIKPFSCDACTKMFRDSTSLKRHSCKIRKSIIMATTDTL